MKSKSMRTILLNFVENNGPQTWNTLHKVVLMVAGQPMTRNEWGSGYLDQVSASSVCRPTMNESRYLERGADGLYRIRYR
jgi:hypothetical protein